MTTYLLDVNVLIALFDLAHVQHEVAHDWFAQEGQQAFATCPLTENGLLRILGHAKYPGTPGTPAEVMRLLLSLRALPGHHFWPDSISLADRALVDGAKLSSAAQLTDTYLLALAKFNGGQLASMDKRLVLDGVAGGRKAFRLI